ncbi:MAG: NAD-binding protein [Vulcanimicrobiota bacterium]
MGEKNENKKGSDNTFKSFWKENISKNWDRLEWPFIIFLWIFCITLGYIGFKKYTLGMNQPRSDWDILYLSIQLFTLESGSVYGPVSWELEVARLLAPGVAAYSAIKALISIFHQQFQLFYVRFLKKHLVICGLGSKGFLMAREFHKLGYEIVIIEKDEENSHIPICREKNIIVLTGDATDMDMLEKAQVHRAKYLIAVCGDDGINAEVAVKARKLTQDNNEHILTCLVHIYNSQLQDFLVEQEVLSGKVSSFRLETFNIFQSGARALLLKYSPLQDKNPSVLLIGLQQMADSIIEELAKSWKKQNTDVRIKITVMDWLATEKIQSLKSRNPALRKFCDFHPLNANLGPGNKMNIIFRGLDFNEFDYIYVCLEDDSLTISSALQILHLLPELNKPVIAVMNSDTGLATLIKAESNRGPKYANLHAFGLWNQTCNPAILLEGINEKIARAFHETYFATRQQEIGTSPSLVPWNELPEQYRESNRRKADQVYKILKEMGLEVKPLTDWSMEPLELTDEEVEKLAEAEHNRWYKDKIAAGFKLGPRNDEKKANPYLMEWKKLESSQLLTASEIQKVKSYNLDEARQLPRLLLDAGFRIHRRK